MLHKINPINLDTPDMGNGIDLPQQLWIAIKKIVFLPFIRKTITCLYNAWQKKPQNK